MSSCVAMLLILAVGCAAKKSKKSDAKLIQESIREILNTKPLAQRGTDIAGVWQGDNSEVILLVDDQHRAIVLNVADMGELQQDSAGNIHIKSASPGAPAKIEYFGTFANGKIFRHQYDYKETFLRK